MGHAPRGIREAALLHVPDVPFAYGTAPRTLRVILRIGVGDVVPRSVMYNDRYAWEGDDYAPLRQHAPLTVYARDGDTEYWSAELTLRRPRFRYRFALEGEEGVRWFGADGLREQPAPRGAFEYAYLSETDRPAIPAWARGATFYQIFPDRFERGDGRRPAAWHRPPRRDTVLGGDLDGITARLDHLASLSVDALYLTPIFAAPSAHKYDTADFFTVDPRFGGNLALRRLVDALHRRGMRVLLDGVFNHAGNTWPPFVDVQRNGRASRYAGWFHLDDVAPAPPTTTDIEPHDPGDRRVAVADAADTAPDPGAPFVGYETWATDVPTLPKLRTSDPALRALVCRIGRFWIEEFGIDGWRLDVANEVDHATWRAFRSAVREAAPEAFLVGEVWQSAMPWLRGDELDSVMDYPMREAILGYAAPGGGDARRFLDGVDRIRAMYPEPLHASMYGLLGSHDVERALTACGGDRGGFAFATALRFALPGAVSIYYGDEVGMEGGNDPACRAGMVWDAARQDATLLRLHRRLGAIRRRHAALRYGVHRRVLDDGPVAAFSRVHDTERLVVVANAGTDGASVSMEAIDAALCGPVHGMETFGYADALASVSGTTVTVPPRSVTLIEGRPGRTDD